MINELRGAGFNEDTHYWEGSSWLPMEEKDHPYYAAQHLEIVLHKINTNKRENKNEKTSIFRIEKMLGYHIICRQNNPQRCNYIPACKPIINNGGLAFLARVLIVNPV